MVADLAGLVAAAMAAAMAVFKQYGTFGELRVVLLSLGVPTELEKHRANTH